MMRLIKHQDCSITIPRKHKETEARLDKEYDRCANQLKWYPKLANGMDIQDLVGKYQGHDGYIIGKGISLDRIAKEMFTDLEAPVLAINESIFKIEKLDLSNPVFGFQCDPLLGRTCKPKISTMLISSHIAYFYPELTNKYTYNYSKHVIQAQSLSAQICLSLLEEMGCKYINMLAFDACTVGATAYADCIGHKPEGDPSRFLSHCNRIKNTAGSLGVTLNWVKPSDPVSPSSDTLEQSLDNQPEHHAPHSYQSSTDSPDISDSPLGTE